MTRPDETEDLNLSAHFAAAREARVTPGDDLVARVLAEADAIRMERLSQASVTRGPWAQMSAILGGWRGMGGFAATALAGVWLGYMPPGVLDGAVGGALGGAETISLWPDGAAEIEELFADG